MDTDKRNSTRRGDGKLGFAGLTAVVFGSVIGGSIFNLAQNLARKASAGPVAIAWGLTGLGMLLLVMVFKRLADARPDLKAGIYEYAQDGFGDYIGFNMAWGYWLCVLLGNVTYAVMISDSVGAFFPILTESPWAMVIFGTILVWLMYAIVSRGVKSASAVNMGLSILKFSCIVLIICVLCICVKMRMFTYDFWGRASYSVVGSISTQVDGCMLVTLWSFMGIEGAVMMSGRARRSRDVGRASLTGFLLALALYLVVSFLCFGVMTRRDMAALPNPSLAYLLGEVAGPWAKWFVIISVIVSLLGCFVAWTLICAQVPYEAAKVGIFPRKFTELNRHGTPWYGMIVASWVMSVVLVLVVTAENAYLAALNLTTMMVLPPYMFCGLYLIKLAMRRDGKYSLEGGRTGNVILGGAATLFIIYIMWAAGFQLLMVTSTFYLAGTWFYIRARREHGARQVFSGNRLVILLLLIILSLISIYLVATGHVRLDG